MRVWSLLLATCCLPLLGASEPKGLLDPTAAIWSRTVDGLRIRLAAEQREYKRGEKLQLRLEIQNASDKTVMLERPAFNPIVKLVTPGEKKVEQEEGFRGVPWELTAEPRGTRLQRMRHLQAVLRQSMLMKLSPGETHIVECEITTGAMLQKLQVLRPGQPQRETLSFPAGDDPGWYGLRAVYRQTEFQKEARQKGIWQPKQLCTPPLYIKIKQEAVLQVEQ